MSVQRKAPVTPPILTVVNSPTEGLQMESLADRIERLQTEARNLAREQVAALEAKLMEAGALAHEISLGGDAYPVGVREITRKLSEDTVRAAKTLGVFMTRAQS
jgi:hypothetical protein